MPPPTTSLGYATVTLTQVGNGPGVVAFQVTPNPSSNYATTLSTFGVTSFTFNTSLAITTSSFTWVSPAGGCECDL